MTRLFAILISALIGFSLAATASTKKGQLVLFLGDSLTAGYGVLKEESYPELLKQQWLGQGRSIQVINGAESGSLSSNLADRLRFYLKRFSPDLIVIASGGNDARQLTPVKVIEANLSEAIRLAKAKTKKVALVQMRIFPNLGKEYAENFAALYPKIAKKEKVSLIPFFLEGVAGNDKLNQADGFHPNAAGHKKISEFLQPYLEKML